MAVKKHVLLSVFGVYHNRRLNPKLKYGNREKWSIFQFEFHTQGSRIFWVEGSETTVKRSLEVNFAGFTVPVVKTKKKKKEGRRKKHRVTQL